MFRLPRYYPWLLVLVLLISGLFLHVFNGRFSSDYLFGLKLSRSESCISGESHEYPSKSLKRDHIPRMTKIGLSGPILGCASETLDRLVATMLLDCAIVLHLQQMKSFVHNSRFVFDLFSYPIFA